jgi:hypothetical protein
MLAFPPPQTFCNFKEREDQNIKTKRLTSKTYLNNTAKDTPSYSTKLPLWLS